MAFGGVVAGLHPRTYACQSILDLYNYLTIVVHGATCSSFECSRSIAATHLDRTQPETNDISCSTTDFRSSSRFRKSSGDCSGPSESTARPHNYTALDPQQAHLAFGCRLRLAAHNAAAHDA